MNVCNSFIFSNGNNATNADRNIIQTSLYGITIIIFLANKKHINKQYSIQVQNFIKKTYNIYIYIYIYIDSNPHENLVMLAQVNRNKLILII